MKEFFKNLRDRFLSPVLISSHNYHQETTEMLNAILKSTEDISNDKNSLTDYGYRYLLNREPDIDAYTKHNSKSWQELRDELLKSLEYQIANPSLLYIDALKTKELLALEISNGLIPHYEDILEQQYSKIIKPGNTIIDIGAHVGRHLSVFIELTDTGKVIAFEPLPHQYKELSINFNQPNVQIYNMALSDSMGIMDFYENISAPEESGLQKRIYNNPEIAEILLRKVQVSTLDNTINNSYHSVDYMKIDAEGAEIAILKGGLSTIKNFRPIISIEYGYPSYSVYGHTKETLFELCNSIDYIITDIFGNLIPTKSMWLNLCDSVYWDYFLVPQEKIEYFLNNIHTSV